MKTSPARRVYQFLKKANDIQSSRPNIAMVAWAHVLGIVDLNTETQITPALEDRVLLGLRDLRDEVTEVELSVTDPEATEALVPLANTARLLTATSQLHADWNGVKTNHLRPEFLGGWKWASISLVATEDDVTQEMLDALRSELDELEAAAEQSGIPPGLRRLVKKQVQIIRDALARYNIRGAGPLRDAVSQGLGELLRDQADISASADRSTEQTSTLLTKLKTVWTSAAHICGDFDKFEKGYQLLVQVYDKALPLLEHIGHVIGN